ncbi:MAG: DUF5995 family protein [Jatrophihabitantaceae bacterium]
MADVAARLRRRLDSLPPDADHRAPSLSAYLRTTEAVDSALRDGLFTDPEWVQRWDAARLLGEDAYRIRLAELEVLSAARVADLLASGQVLLRLAVAGFGVALPPAANR